MKKEADFTGGNISSDAGLLLLREADKRHGLTRQLAGALNDSRMSAIGRDQTLAG